MKNIIYKCPVCGNSLQESGLSYRCGQNHSFDIAKEGYVNLLLPNQKSSKEPGDSKSAVISRRNFLNKGYYDSLSNQLNEKVLDLLVDKSGETNILDIGCGEGFYLSKIKEYLSNRSLSQAINYWGLDVSKAAIQQAIKRNASINLCVGNAYSLPYLDNSIDIVLSIFAPIDLEETSRVMKNDANLVVVIPGKDHLSGLVKLVYDKSESRQEDKDPIKGNEKLTLVDSQEIKNTIQIVGKDKISDLLQMTPYYWHINLGKKSELEKLDELSTEIGFKILTYKKRS